MSLLQAAEEGSYESNHKRLQQMDDPCMGVMMPMVFEMGHEVIYLFEGYATNL